MLARASMRRCQRSSAGAASARPERRQRHVVAEGDRVQQRLPGQHEARRRRPAAPAHDLVALGHQPAHRLDREEVVDARFEPGPAGAAERAGEARPVDDPRPLLVARGGRAPRAPPRSPPTRRRRRARSSRSAAPGRRGAPARPASRRAARRRRGRAGCRGRRPPRAGRRVRASSIHPCAVAYGPVREGSHELNRRKQDVLAWESRWSLPAGLADLRRRGRPDRLARS